MFWMFCVVVCGVVCAVVCEIGSVGVRGGGVCGMGTVCEVCVVGSIRTEIWHEFKGEKLV